MLNDLSTYFMFSQDHLTLAQLVSTIMQMVLHVIMFNVFKDLLVLVQPVSSIMHPIVFYLFHVLLIRIN